MSENNTLSKIEFLEEQIEEITNSGFFTEREIDRLSHPLLLEMYRLKNQTIAKGQPVKEHKINFFGWLKIKIKF